MEIAPCDTVALARIRGNVRAHIKASAERYDHPGAIVLDVAPQDHQGAAEFFCSARLETLDVAAAAGPTYTADLCADNSSLIESGRFDLVVLTEVLEHVLNPFDAAREIFRVLKPGGEVYVTTPFNFRIHGPLPDCWRFTEHGLRAVFSAFEEVEIRQIETEDRWLMPLQYLSVFRKPQS